MTLITGITLPKGVLLVSDTREVHDQTGEVVSEFKRKITIITPRVFLAGSGSESNFYTARVLRNCLYNAHSTLSTIDVRENILDLYEKVNHIHRENHSLNHPMGELLVAEYNKEMKEFNLLHQSGLVGFNSFNILNKVKDIEIIGSNEEVRTLVKKDIRKILDSLEENEINSEYIYEFMAVEIHKIFKKLKINSIGKSVYCTYLTEINNEPSSAVFFIHNNNELSNLESKEDGEEIQL